MKLPQKYSLLATTLILTLFLAACNRSDYYNAAPVGYQYSFVEDFNSNQNGWAFNDNRNDAHVAIGNGLLKYTFYPLQKGTNSVAINTGMQTNRNFEIATRIESNNAMALVFGVGNGEFGYSFLIDDQGYFAVYDEGNARTAATAIIDWTTNNAIRQGWNEVVIEQLNGQWIGYINGSQAFSMAAYQLYGNEAGFMVLDGTTGFADYLEVQW